MSDRRKDLRPREKLAHKGPAALSDYELLMAIIGSGNAQADVTKIARELLKVLRRDRELRMETVRTVVGVGGAPCTRPFRMRLEVPKREHRGRRCADKVECRVCQRLPATHPMRWNTCCWHTDLRTK
jgi:DNA repair protein RadC